MKVFLGWIPVLASGQPHRATKSKGHWRQRTEPLKVYRTRKMAEAQSPDGKAAEASMETPSVW